MNSAPYRTIKSATYTPSAERTDDGDHVSGDVTYVTFEECDHVMRGNPIMTYKIGSKCPCWACKAAISEPPTQPGMVRGITLPKKVGW